MMSANFIDAEPAKFSLIRGTSNVWASADLDHEYIRIHYGLQDVVGPYTSQIKPR